LRLASAVPWAKAPFGEDLLTGEELPLGGLAVALLRLDELVGQQVGPGDKGMLKMRTKGIFDRNLKEESFTDGGSCVVVHRLH
jgi:hypothetical protein